MIAWLPPPSRSVRRTARSALSLRGASEGGVTAASERASHCSTAAYCILAHRASRRRVKERRVSLLAQRIFLLAPALATAAEMRTQRRPQCHGPRVRGRARRETLARPRLNQGPNSAGITPRRLRGGRGRQKGRPPRLGKSREGQRLAVARSRSCDSRIVLSATCPKHCIRIIVRRISTIGAMCSDIGCWGTSLQKSRVVKRCCSVWMTWAAMRASIAD